MNFSNRKIPLSISIIPNKLAEELQDLSLVEPIL